MKFFKKLAIASALAVGVFVSACSPDAVSVEGYISPQISPPAWVDAHNSAVSGIVAKTYDSDQAIPAYNRTPRYKSLSITQDDIDLMAKIVYWQGLTQNESTQKVIAEVILNRAASPNFPNSIGDVIWQPGQFSVTAALKYADPGITEYAAVADAICLDPYTSEDVVFFGTEPVNDQIWGFFGDYIFCKEYVWE